MKNLMKSSVALYGVLLRLYPGEFQLEFGDELRDVFAALLRDSASTGTLALVTVCLRELCDFPINLLRNHLEKTHMSRFFGSGPTRFNLRTVLAFGAVFAAYQVTFALIYGQMLWNMIMLSNGLIDDAERFSRVSIVSFLFAWSMAALIGGTVLAVVFGEHPHLRWSVITGFVGLLPWFFQLELNWMWTRLIALLAVAVIGGVLSAAILRESARFRRLMLLGLIAWLPVLIPFGMRVFYEDYAPMRFLLGLPLILLFVWLERDRSTALPGKAQQATV